MRLITKPIAAAMIAAYDHAAEVGESGKEIVAKYFTPWAGATWYISEGRPVDKNGEPVELEAGKDWAHNKDVTDWHLFGFADLGDPTMAELGYVMLSDLLGLKGPAGLEVERDLHYSGTMADVMAEYGRAA